MNDDESVLYSIEGPVAVIELNRPAKKNAVDPGMRLMLSECLDRAIHDGNVSAVVLAAAGDAFGSGQDLNVVDDISIGAFDLIERHIKPIILKIHHAPKPVIAAVNGACAGVSASIALSCDLAVMADNAFFYMAFSTIGLVPDGGAGWHLVKSLGMKRAYQVLAESGRIDAATALSSGLVNKVASADVLLKEAVQWAKQLSMQAPLSLRHTKAALREVINASLEESISIEARLQSICASSEDSREAMQAFREKRRPVFRGR